MPLARPPSSVALALGGALAIALVALAPSGTARADCQPDAPVAGQTVTCSGTDEADGFSAGAVDDIDVVVEGTAEIDNGGIAATPTIQVNDRNTVTVEAGAQVTASGDGNHAIEIGNDNNATEMGAGTADGVTSSGDITVTGNTAGGISGGDDNDVTHDGSILAGGAGVNDAFGIRLGNDATLVQQLGGSITVSGPGSVGVEIGNGDGDPGPDPTVELDLNGTVLVTGETGTATGVIIGNDVNANVSGNIDASADGGGTAIGIVAGDDNLIDFSGDIDVDVTGGATGIGIQLGDGNTLTMTGDVDVNGTGGTGIQATAAANSNTILIEAGGSAVVDDDGTAAIDLSLSTGGTNTIELRGFLGAGTTGMFGTALEGSDGIEDVLLGSSSSVVGDIMLGLGNDIVTLNPGATGDGLIHGEDGTDELRLRGTGIGRLDLDRIEGFESLNIDDMSVDSTFGAWVFSGGAEFPGGATLVNGVVEFQNTVTIDGDFTIQNDSIFAVAIDPISGTSGQLELTGGSTFTFDGANTELLVSFLRPLLASDTYTLIDASAGGGTISGSFGTIPTDTTLLQYSLLSPMPDILQLQVIRSSYTVAAQTPNQQSTASYLDAVLAAGGIDPSLENLLLDLDGLDPAGLRRAYDAFHPEAYDAHTSGMIAMGRQFADAAARPRLLCKSPFQGLDPVPVDDTPCGRGGYNAWMRLLLSEWNRDASDFFESKGSQQAIAGGLDWRVHRRVQLTGYVGIGSTDVDVHGVGDGEIQSYEIGAAAHIRLGGARLRTAVGYGRGDHEQDRRISFATTDRQTNGKFDSNRVHSLVEFGWEFAFGDFLFEPIAGVDVTWIAEDAFEEDELSTLELEVDERENVVVSSEIGARIAYRHHVSAYEDHFVPWGQGTWTPELSARWRGTWVGADREIDSRIVGASAAAGDFTVDAEDSKQGVDVGARVTFQPHGSGGSFSLGYDGFFGDKGTNHRFGGELEVYF